MQIAPYLNAVVVNRGSDLHIKAGGPPRIRISGSLVPLQVDPLTADQSWEIIRETMPAEVAEEFTATNEADYALHVPEIGRFRVNAFRTRGTVSSVLRLVGDEPVPLAQLGVPDVVRRLALEPRGLVLVTGPTGSGKTTTLAGMVDAVNESRAVHVLTLEDPIEVVHRDKLASVSQREVGTDTKAWSTALRAAMRQDPDVILIGEMRDAETVKAALAAAETGHFVMSTLHTTDATETVNRIIDFFPPHEQKQVRLGLAASLRGIVCQRLVPRATGEGRVCAMEIAVNTPRLAEAVADPEKTDTLQDVVGTGGYSGMQTFDQHLLQLVLEGSVSIQDGRLASSNPHDFSVMLKRAGIDPSLVDGATTG
ncbi:type IV pili twitching motility protein PilT [Nocardioides gansuensis]|uniref:Type IV pili twitching motility protein PilT n=1 Tax=Nocardioides gansuensis TaxID=2138300 RepID=A0A2T8F7W4_9ACTN|nr:type IV pili twitching motility protein PilT [Nocardioides gansuensis]